MVISDFAIRRPIVTIVVMLALVVFGLFALVRLDVDEFPDVSNPVVVVGVPYPGASPDVVEREVTDRLEEAFSGISGVDQMMSTSTDGFSQIIVQFVFQKSVDQASQDIRDAISSVRDKLPQEMKEPVIRRFDPADLPIVSIILSSPSMDAAALTRLADPGMTRELRTIEGVAQVNVVGGQTRELTVLLRPSDLKANGVAVSDVVNALGSQNLAAPVGSIKGPLEERAIRLQGRLNTPQDFEQLVVTQRNGQPIRLGQVAEARDGTEEPTTAAMYNGREAVGIDIVKSKGYSTTSVSDAIKAKVAEIQQTLPPGVRLNVVRDAGVRVRDSVHNVEEMLLEGALLTVLVVFLFLNSWRSTVITGLALPVSTLAAFIAVLAFGFTLNTMSLLGLSLAIGILIDDAIVVRENIVRHIEMGEDHFAASHRGTDEIGLAVAATTFSIIAVFVPVAFMSGVAGQWFKPFALTIAAAVLVSLFVSFSLDPMLSAYWADPQTEQHQHRNVVARTLERFNDWFDRQADRYTGVIAWALDHRWWMVLIAEMAFVGAIALQAAFGGFGFVPVSDNSEMNVAVETPPGSSLDYTRIKAEEVGRILRAYPEVAYTYTTIGSANGSGAVDEGTIYVRLVPKSQRSRSQDELGRAMRQQLDRIGGADAYVYDAGFLGNQKQIQLQVRGPDANELTALATRIADTVRKVPGAVDVGLSTRGQKPELEVDINRGLAGSMGITVGQVAQSLRPAFAGIQVGTWVDPTGESRDVEVRYGAQFRTSAEDLRQVPIIVGGGAGQAPQLVPLSQVATITQGLGPAQIDHLDRDRVVTVGANAENVSVGNLSQAVMRRVSASPLPPGYKITQGGEVKSQNEVFGGILRSLALAIMLMYLILVVQFGSFLDPLAIMISLPLSLIGVVLALFVTHDTINLMSLIGVILLTGIVAKNAILLIDFAKWAREQQGLSRRDALIQAGRIRLRPIMMTTVALIAGMMPVALGLGEGADFRAPLGRAVIGGVITSTLLTLIVIPTVYEILDEWKEKAAAALGFAHRPRGPREGIEVGPIEPVADPGD